MCTKSLSHHFSLPQDEFLVSCKSNLSQRNGSLKPPAQSEIKTSDPKLPNSTYRNFTRAHPQQLLPRNMDAPGRLHPGNPRPSRPQQIPRFPPRRYPAIFSHHRRPVDPFSISKGTRFWKTQLSKRDSPPRSQMKMATSEARARKRSSFCCWEQSRIIRLGFSRRSSRRRLSGWRR